MSNVLMFSSDVPVMDEWMDGLHWTNGQTDIGQTDGWRDNIGKLLHCRRTSHKENM